MEKTKQNDRCIYINENTKIETLKKEFNEKYPYLHLRIGVYELVTRKIKKGFFFKKEEKKWQIFRSLDDDSKTLAEVRIAGSGGEISISGNKHVEVFIKEFDTLFGLVAKVACIEKDDSVVHLSSIGRTFSQTNKYCEAHNCLKRRYFELSKYLTNKSYIERHF